MVKFGSKMRWVGLLLFLITASLAAQDLSQILASEHRSAENKLRDQYRNPEQVIQFFGIQPHHHVLEVWPGSGWYSEILAPYLKERGQFHAAIFSPDNLNSDDKQEAFWSKVSQKYTEKMSDTKLYGAVNLTIFENAIFQDKTLKNTMDIVFVARTLHIWDERGEMLQALASLFHVLKPGGVLAIIQHRANSISDYASVAGEGYMDQRYVVEAAEQAGFVLEAVSDVNQNFKDTKDYPRGVYALPPTLAMGSTDKEKYTAIGESDRMTLKFVKPLS